MVARQSEASDESRSKRPNTRDKTWKLFFFSLCKRHTAHHQVQQRCHHFDWLSLCVPPTGQPEVCSSSEQASWSKSACTEGSCSFLLRYYLCPRRYLCILYSNCVHRRSSPGPPVTVNRWSSRTDPDCWPFSSAQTDRVTFISSEGGVACWQLVLTRTILTVLTGLCECQWKTYIGYITT